MSVLIKGVQMPTGCADCPLLSDWDVCQATGREIEHLTDERMARCPLVEVPTSIIDKLMLIYESARISGCIEKPWAWSLYQTWKWCDKAEEGWHRDGSNENSNHMA